MHVDLASISVVENALKIYVPWLTTCICSCYRKLQTHCAKIEISIYYSMPFRTRVATFE